MCGRRATFLTKDQHLHLPGFLTIKLNNLNDARKDVQQQTALMFSFYGILSTRLDNSNSFLEF